MSLFDLSGKVAAITGSTKGIGLGIAREMAAAGAKVVISSRDGPLCDRVAADLNRDYGKGEVIARGLACDLGDLKSVEAFADQAPKLFGGLDILVCNAAIFPYVGPPENTPPDRFDAILCGNIHHNYRLCQGVRAAIASRGGGSMIMISSASSSRPLPITLAYAVAKAGLEHLALCLAQEFVGEKIRVNSVIPGLIRSHGSSASMGDEGLATAATSIPLRRVGEPADIAGAVIYLASAAGQHVTGERILVDGGYTRVTAAGSIGLEKVQGDHGQRRP